MNHGANKGIMIAVGVFIVLAFGLFGYIIYQNQYQQAELEQEIDEIVDEEPVDTTRIITAKHDYIDGKHIFVGVIDVPTQCHRLEHEVVFIDGNVSNVEIQFTTHIDDPDALCAQVIQSAPFKVEFEAPENAAVSATLNGEGIVLNPVEVPEGEDLESFSEFYKG